MKLLLILVPILFFVSCGHDYENTVKQKKLFEQRQSQPFDTLIAVFTVNTGSQDLYYIQGRLTLPADIKSQLSGNLSRDIKVCGNFPKDLIEVTSWNYSSDHAFKIIGKTILADTIHVVGTVPLFYVTEWSKFNYNYNSWIEKGDLGTFPKRNKMMDDILKYFELDGRHVNEITRLLGEPDFNEPNEIAYKVDEQYGPDIDPIATTNLTFKFDKDSIIVKTKIDKWKRRAGNIRVFFAIVLLWPGFARDH